MGQWQNRFVRCPSAIFRMAVLNAKLIVGTYVAVAAAAITLYDVQPNFVFSMPDEFDQPDPVQEVLYQQCYQAQDDQIHDTAFRTIDNPDVQKEFINTGRARAARECRDKYPQRWVTEPKPFVLNLFDLQPRYW
jgi:hypothetical protein